MIDLKAIYGDAKYHEFAIHSLSFNLDESNPILVIEVGHYSQKEIVRINFEGVYYHSAMSESFIFMNDDDSWELDIFIARAQSSKLIPWLASYTLLGAEHIVELSKLSHYRVYAQDHFMDIVCTGKPMLDLLDET
ncbi:MAG: hypothetical protein NVV73_01345 [Cellvibrionaceae bacterium]|nr:hypothetical protein [Cellvibrionaceae bacterium]